MSLYEFAQVCWGSNILGKRKAYELVPVIRIKATVPGSAGKRLLCRIFKLSAKPSFQFVALLSVNNARVQMLMECNPLERVRFPKRNVVVRD
ncbi:hypothetical protein Xgly_09255 [Xanthomonas citri pv. glycines]|uniref:Uncharacterized protein n=1 Tax=Xanthomonas campestris pv. glycines TaxID=473421 RepID=A0AAX0HXG6_XANCG|nr:hypothetical protein BIY41_19260 [Xanthomonas citri pv. glycines]OOX04562.1 hypothetical protein Xgly_09255 [Xanthomonas citri pv. glycines]